MIRFSKPRAIAVGVATASLVISACSADNPVQSQLHQAQDALGQLSDVLDEIPTDLADLDVPTGLADVGGEGSGGEGQAGSDDGASGSTHVLEQVEFLVDPDGTTPDGWTRTISLCQAQSKDDRANGGVTFAVPSDWTVQGRSMGGGTSPLGDPFETGFKNGASVDFTSAIRRPRDDKLKDSGTDQLWTSFDYDWSSYGDGGEQSGTITFESIGTAQLGEQQAEVFYADPAQNPEVLGTTATYKTHVDVARIPNPAPGSQTGYRTATFTVTIEYDNSEGALDPAVVTTIVSSVGLPECARHIVVVSREVMLNADLNGDGVVATVDDMRAAMANIGSFN